MKLAWYKRKMHLKKSLLALFQAIIEYFSDWTYPTKKMNFEKLLNMYKFAKNLAKNNEKTCLTNPHFFSSF